MLCYASRHETAILSGFEVHAWRHLDTRTSSARNTGWVLFLFLHVSHDVHSTASLLGQLHLNRQWSPARHAQSDALRNAQTLYKQRPTIARSHHSDIRAAQDSEKRHTWLSSSHDGKHRKRKMWWELWHGREKCERDRRKEREEKKREEKKRGETSHLGSRLQLIEDKSCSHVCAHVVCSWCWDEFKFQATAFWRGFWHHACMDASVLRDLWFKVGYQTQRVRSGNWPGSWGSSDTVGQTRRRIWFAASSAGRPQNGSFSSQEKQLRQRQDELRHFMRYRVYSGVINATWVVPAGCARERLGPPLVLDLRRKLIALSTRIVGRFSLHAATKQCRGSCAICIKLPDLARDRRWWLGTVPWSYRCFDHWNWAPWAWAPRRANAEAYMLCPRNSRYLGKSTNEDVAKTPEGSNAWMWHNEICSSCGLSLTGWDEFATWLSVGNLVHCRQRRKKSELCVASWNVQRVSSGLSTFVQHVSGLEEWDAILLQDELRFWMNWRLHLEATTRWQTRDAFGTLPLCELWILRDEGETLRADRAREGHPRGVAAEIDRWDKVAWHRGVEQRRGAIRQRKDARAAPRIWEPCNVQEEQWDDVLLELEPKSTTQFQSQNRATCGARRRRVGEAAEAGDEPAEHPTQSPCSCARQPSRSLSRELHNASNAAKVEVKQARSWT